jgi:hypothetical protein
MGNHILKSMLLLLMPICFSLMGGPMTPPKFEPANVPSSAADLNVIVIEGQNSVPRSMDLAAEVRDENDRQVEGAKVTFWLKLMGSRNGFEGAVRRRTPPPTSGDKWPFRTAQRGTWALHDSATVKPRGGA